MFDCCLFKITALKAHRSYNYHSTAWFFLIFVKLTFMKSRLLLQLTLLVAISSCDKKSSSAPNAPQPEDTAAVEIKTTILAQNLTLPWEILWGPDNFIWMTERGGRVSRVHPESGA